MQLKINWDHKRAKHAIERMWLRGLSQQEVIRAIQQGQKRKQKKSGLIEAFHSYYSVIYTEHYYETLRKIYPITVKIW